MSPSRLHKRIATVAPNQYRSHIVRTQYDRHQQHRDKARTRQPRASYVIGFGQKPCFSNASCASVSATNTKQRPSTCMRTALKSGSLFCSIHCLTWMCASSASLISACKLLAPAFCFPSQVCAYAPSICSAEWHACARPQVGLHVFIHDHEIWQAVQADK